MFNTSELLGGPAPSNFAFLFVDPNTNFPLFDTTDPSAADYLFRVTIYGAGYVLDKPDCATLNSPATTCLNVVSGNNGEVSLDVEDAAAGRAAAVRFRARRNRRAGLAPQA